MQLYHFPGTTFDKSKFYQEFMSKIGLPFCNDTKVYPVEPVGDPIQAALSIHQKYQVAPDGKSWQSAPWAMKHFEMKLIGYNHSNVQWKKCWLFYCWSKQTPFVCVINWSYHYCLPAFFEFKLKNQLEKSFSSSRCEIEMAVLLGNSRIQIQNWNSTKWRKKLRRGDR